MRPIGVLLPPLVALFAFALPAAARNISAETALEQKTPIAVGIGDGHTLDFSQTGEQVFRGWLGDGGRCIMLSPSSPLESGASMINLRRITPCQDVAGLPAVDETTLTLVTLTPAGETHIYEFSIAYGATGDSLTRLVPPGQLPETTTTASSGVERTSLNPMAVESGLRTFSLEPDSPVVARVNAWLEAISEGQGHRLAAQAVSLDWTLLERLEAIGREAALVGGAIER